MKTLIAICSYDGDALNGNHDAIRETWGRDCQAAGFDLRFFIGRRFPDFQPKADEILIDWEQPRTCQHPFEHSQEGCCFDFWQKLTKEILSWGLTNDYDYIYLAENDTFLVPLKLSTTGFERYDFSGYFEPKGIALGTKSEYDIYGHRLYAWPEPGAGYFVSRKTAELILAAPPSHWSLGMYAGQILGPYIASSDITACDLSNFWNEAAFHYQAVTGKGYPPNSDWQQKMYKENQ